MSSIRGATMQALRVLALLCIASTALAQAQGQPQGQPGLGTNPDGSSRPVPDPTYLTTQAQEKAIVALREVFDARFKALLAQIAIDKETLDKADARLVKRLDDVPDQTASALLHLQRLMEEKFKGVDQQFAGRDVALAAALLAQKTSVDEQNKANAASSAKAEGATTKQIDGIQLIIQANSKVADDKIDGVKALLGSYGKATDDKITDIRNTLSDLRSTQSATASRSTGQSDLWAYMIMGGGFMVAVVGLLWPRLSNQQAPQPHYAQYPPPPYYYGNGQQSQQPPPPQVSVVPVVPVVNVTPPKRAHQAAQA